MTTRILILCTGNSARSQMAEGLLRSFDRKLAVFSAGTQPAARVHPAAVEAMREISIDIGRAYPRNVAQFLDQPFDFVLTVCDAANETCPLFTGPVARRLHIGFEDPARAEGSPSEVLAAFRRVRDQIQTRLYRFYLADIKGWTLRAATTRDLPLVSALLTECKLPLDGLADQFGGNYVIAAGAGATLGVAGIEIHGPNGLLRSVAVSPVNRGTGLGAALVRDRIAWAKGSGLQALYLLTTTAASYFPTLGFEPVPRDEAPPDIRSSREFVSACPASATFMRRNL
jgi:arsenate reductase (thioredoxin)